MKIALGGDDGWVALNRALVAIGALLTAAALGTWLWPPRPVPATTEAAPSEQTTAPDDHRRRLGNPFRVTAALRPAAPPPTAPTAPPAPPPVPLAQRVEHLKAVGYMDGAPPEVIMENRKTNRTLYLRVGDTVDGFRVENVAPDRTTLTDGIERVDLDY